MSMHAPWDSQDTIAAILHRRAEQSPEQVALRFLGDRDGSEKVFTYRALHERAMSIAAGLQAKVAPGERALLLLPSGLDYVAAFFGCLYAGVIATPAYPPQSLGARHMGRLLAIAKDARPRLLLTRESGREAATALRAALPDPDRVEVVAVDRLEGVVGRWIAPPLGRDDIAFLQYTSGSTAAPKGVMVSHGNILANEAAISRGFGLQPTDVWISWLPLFHDMGLIGCLLQPIYSGAALVLMSPRSFIERPLRWLEAISSFGATVSGGPDFAFRLCVERIAAPLPATLDLSRWRVAFCGSEPIRPGTFHAFAETFSAAGFSAHSFHPCYGLAESTLFVTAKRPGAKVAAATFDAGDISGDDPASRGLTLISCGEGCEESDIRVVDPAMETDAGPDSMGEVWVSGASVAQGYWQNQQATGETFVERAGKRYLRTGDLAFRRDGQIFIAGRLKDLIIIRGQNLHPQDIELTIEEELEAARRGRVAAFPVEVNGTEGIGVAVEISKRTQKLIDPEKVAQAIHALLTEVYQEGASLILLVNPGALPMTSSGKLQRSACLPLFENGSLDAFFAWRRGEPEGAERQGRSVSSVGQTTTETKTAEWLAAVWSELFGREIDARDAHFFELGGNSLLAAQLTARVADQWRLAVEPSLLFEKPSFAAFASAIARLRDEMAARDIESAGEGADAFHIVAVGDHNPPLSFAQSRLWFLWRLEPDSAAYNLPLTMRLRGCLRIGPLSQAFCALRQRHEILRTRFRECDGATIQVIDEAGEIDVAVEDISDMAPGEREARAQAIAAAEAGQPFDLENGPSFRVKLVRLADDDHLLLVTAHHIVADGWSLTIFLRELAALYAGFSRGEEAALQPPSIQYGDYALWQRRWLGADEADRQLAYWRERLGDAHPPLTSAFDRPRPAARSGRGATVDIRVHAALATRLRELARARDVTLFMVLLAAFYILLRRRTGESDLRVGAPFANRRRTETEGLIGFFVNTLVLRHQVDDRIPFAALLAEVKDAVSGAHANQDLPFERLVEILRPERTLAHNPLFQVKFNYGFAAPSLVDFGGLRIESLAMAPAGAHFDLALDVMDAGDEIEGFFTYATDVFDADTIHEWKRDFLELLESAVHTPEARLRDLSPRPATRRSGAAHVFDSSDVLALRRRNLPADIDGLALCGGSRDYSHRQLEEASNRLAHCLASHGVGREDRVALVVERSPEWVVGLLGILKSGAAYVPLDPAAPDARLRALIAECGASAVVSRGAALARLAADPGRAPQVEFIALEDETLALFDAEPPQVDIPPGQAAYVIYTSGSTGKPKGVVVSHGALADYVQGLLQQVRIPPDAGMAMVSSIAADLGHTALFGALCSGRLLDLPGPDVVADADLCAAHLASRRIGVLKIVPGHLRALLQAAEPHSVLPEHVLILGGETADRDLAETVRELKPGCRIVNHYGPTETTVGVLTHEIEAPLAGGGSIPIGRPLPNAHVAILDDELADTPCNAPGDLYVGGEGLARGYLGQPGLTAERFIPDPTGRGERLYRTGDRVKYDRMGRIEFLGRADEQFKIRGYRVEPAEIVEALRALDGVEDAAVVADGDGLDRRLVAYYVATERRAIDGAALRAALERVLPNYMIPACFTQLASLPLTANGKLDRRALPAPQVAGRNVVAPANETEELLVRIWREVLRSETIGVTDNFFEIGGDSIRSLQVIARARKHGLRLTPKAMFERQTIRALASARQADASSNLEPAPLRADRSRPLPLSHAQRRLRFLWDMEPDNPVYNVAGALRLDGELDIDALNRAFSALVARHETLRTSFPALGGDYVQKIASNSLPPIAAAKLSASSPRERRLEAQARIACEARRPFDLEHGPVLRVALLQIDEREHALLVAMHHIVSDGWSLNVLMNEFATLYSSYVRGSEPGLPTLPIQYADYAVWQREWLAAGAGARQLDYWRERLAAAQAPLPLPLDRPRPQKQSYRGANLDFPMPHALAAELRRFAQARSVTLSTLLLTAFATLLCRYSGARDLCVGLPVANRRWTETEGLIGFFVNVLVIRVDLEGAPSFDDLLQRVSARVVEAQTNQDVPFEQVVEALNPERTLAHNPLFQVTYNHRRRDYAPLRNLAGLDAQEPRSDAPITQFDLTLDVEESGDALRTSFTYSVDLFDPPTIARMAEHFVALLRDALADPTKSIGAVSLGLNATAATDAARALAAGGRRLHELIEEQVAATPTAIAVESDAGAWSYAELNARANRLARRLRDLGVGPDVLVGVYLDRAPVMTAALLAILKAGGAYLPLSPDYPPKRIRFMLEDAKPRVLLTETRLLTELGACDARTWCCDRDEGELDDYADGNLFVSVSPDNIAYCVYTSGSTGRPKGVAVSHAAIVNHMEWMRQTFAIDANDRILQKTPFSFDASVWEFWLPLMIGARCVSASAEAGRDPAELWRQVAQHRITVLQCVPSFLRALMESDTQALRRLRYLFCGGEALPPALVDTALRNWDGEFWNLYGPTEAAIDSTAWRCRMGAGPTTPIGAPIANAAIHILDDELNAVPAGVVGEIHIGGAGLARGYLHRPQLTAERFVPDAAAGGGARLYRTGDLARLRPDGLIEYVGRLDQQVKLRGFRIELEEIAAALCAMDGVRDAVVTARDDAAGELRLVGYVVPDTDKLKELRRRDQADEAIRQWESVFETAYDASGQGPNFTGWNSSYDDQPIPEAHMREWLDATVARIADLRPRRMLEIGCGVGLLTQHLAPSCEAYVGTDLSARAIAELAAWIEQRPDLAHVRLMQGEALQFDAMARESFDTVVLNSVVQYFPDGDYLMNVLRAASTVIGDGAIFIGDVRHLALLPTFHASVQFARAPGKLDIRQLRGRIDKAIAQDKELVFDPAFFHAAAGLLGLKARIDIKRARSDNELTRYRYDVVLRCDLVAAPAARMEWLDEDGALAALDARLAAERAHGLTVSNVPNRRLARDVALVDLLQASDGAATVADIHASLDGLTETGEDPESFWRLGAAHGLDVSIGWTPGARRGAFDVEFRNPASETRGPRAPAALADWRPYVTDPLCATLRRRLGARLRDELGVVLPDYMTPAHIITLDAMPLAANGKLDRRALPAPDVADMQKRYVAPRNDHEARLTAIWQDVLQIGRIGVHDNFFELGGHSLLATQVVSRVRADCNVALPLRSLFESPTVAELAEAVERLSVNSPASENIDRFEALFDQLGV
jgi:amino acid adenylation domain-containing protein